MRGRRRARDNAVLAVGENYKNIRYVNRNGNARLTARDNIPERFPFDMRLCFDNSTSRDARSIDTGGHAGNKQK